MHVFSHLFDAGELNPCVVPKDYDAVLRVFSIVPGRTGQFTDHTFTSQAEFVELLRVLRQGARGVCLETEERARELAEEHAQSLATGGACRLMPGATPYELAMVNKKTGVRIVKCGRAGPHSELLAQSVGAVLPLRLGPLQAAQTTHEKEAAVELLKTRSAAAELALEEAAAAATAASADAAATLIQLAATRGQQLDDLVRPEIERLLALLRAASQKLGGLADAFVAARLQLTKHNVRPDVKGGLVGGTTYYYYYYYYYYDLLLIPH